MNWWTVALGVGELLIFWVLLFVTWGDDLGKMPGDRGVNHPSS